MAAGALFALRAALALLLGRAHFLRYTGDRSNRIVDWFACCSNHLQKRQEMNELPKNVNEAPPLFPKWSYWYIFVVTLLLVEIAFFYWISN